MGFNKLTLVLTIYHYLNGPTPNTWLGNGETFNIVFLLISMGIFGYHVSNNNSFRSTNFIKSKMF